MLLLLDEPMSNLDYKVRLELRHELRALQRRIGITAVYVTHDREEALTLADRIAVIDAGRIVQIGAPEEIFHRPESAFVAGFMGADNALDVIAAPPTARWQLRSQATRGRAGCARIFAATRATLASAKRRHAADALVLGGVVAQIGVLSARAIAIACAPTAPTYGCTRRSALPEGTAARSSFRATRSCCFHSSIRSTGRSQ